MAPNQLRDSLRQVPFEPFRVVLSDGSAYDIRHPDLMWVGRYAAFVGLTGSVGEALFERTVKLDLQHITQIVPIDEYTPPAVGAAG